MNKVKLIFMVMIIFLVCIPFLITLVILRDSSSTLSQAFDQNATSAKNLSVAITRGILPLCQRTPHQNIPRELKYALFGLWSCVYPICHSNRPYAKLIETDPFDPGIKNFNQMAITAALLEGIEKSEHLAIKQIDDQLKYALTLNLVKTTPAYIEVSKLKTLDAKTAALLLTAVACFTLVEFDIREETGMDISDAYTVRSSLSIDVSASDLIMKVNIPGCSQNKWPQKWASLYQNTFRRPNTILVQDIARRSLWKWIDQKPRLIVQNIDGKEIFTVHFVPPKDDEAELHPLLLTWFSM
jgi:hypothetical protein